MPESTLSNIDKMLCANGLKSRGIVQASSAALPPMNDGRPARSMLLAGTAGPEHWPHFVSSKEYSDEQANPLDRWSRRIAESIADRTGAECIYPFEGPPYHPFSSWAMIADSVQTSALGMLIHPRYGLSHAYRFALLFPYQLEAATELTRLASICANCTTQPCLHQCPVNAYSTSGFDENRCGSHLAGNTAGTCHDSGCLARNACPVGAEFVYSAEQRRFHMAAFHSAMQGRMSDNS